MQSLNLKFKGLVTQPNALGSVPDGALEQADNVVIDRNDVVESRRGFDFYNTTALGAPSAIANTGGNIFAYFDRLLLHDPVTAKMYFDNNVSPGALAAYTGTFTAPTFNLGTGLVHGTSQNRNFYGTSSVGIKKITGFTAGSLGAAGVAQGLDGQWTAPGTAAKTFMDANVTLGTEQIAIASHGFITAQAVVLTSTGVVPTGLVAGSTYYVIVVSSGVIKLAASDADAVDGTAIDITALNDAAATHTLTPAVDNAAYAYRLLWGIKDANGNLVLGAPSQRVIVTNLTTDFRSNQTIWTIPDSITTSHFYQLYRSGASASVGAEPDDELQLVVEGNPTAGDITAKVITVTDSTPDSLRGATLYTSPSQEGIDASNYRPPFAMDIALFKNVMLYANTRQPQRMFVTLAAPGLMTAATDTMTITDGTNTLTLNAEATENYSGGNTDFQLFTTGTAAENVEDTALSIVRVINRTSANTTWYAYYVSGFEDLPGKIAIENRVIVASLGTFSAVSTAGSAFTPPLPSSGTTYKSTDDETFNRLHMSKTLQPEACPLIQYLQVGSATEPIRRIIPLRDSVFIFKDDGIFRLTGDSISNFSVSLFDTTVRLLYGAVDSAVPLANQIYAFTTQGVCAISDTGVTVVSRPIEPTLQELYAGVSYGIAYESDRKYILSISDPYDLTVPAQMFVYNTLTNAWTRWNRAELFGIVSTLDDKLYLGSYTDNRLRKERKTFDPTDYADEDYAVTISSSSGTTVVLVSTTNLAAGMTLVDSAGTTSKIVSVDSATDITVEDTVTWTAGAATAYTPISCAVTYTPQHAGNPGIVKHFKECTLFFDQADFDTITVGFRSNFRQTFTEVDLEPVSGYSTTGTGSGGAWGMFPWGIGPWGSGGAGPTTTTDAGVARTYYPLETRRALWTQIRMRNAEAFSAFSLLGASLIFDGVGTKFR